MEGLHVNNIERCILFNISSTLRQPFSITILYTIPRPILQTMALTNKLAILPGGLGELPASIHLYIYTPYTNIKLTDQRRWPRLKHRQKAPPTRRPFSNPLRPLRSLPSRRTPPSRLQRRPQQRQHPHLCMRYYIPGIRPVSLRHGRKGNGIEFK